MQNLSNVASSSKMEMAAHLCGERVNEVLDGNDSFVSSLHQMGFRRVQINATKVNGVDTSNLANSVPKLSKLMTKHDNLEFIIQKNDETKPLWEGVLQLDGGVPKNVTMLVDESKGTGKLCQSWPTPPKDYNIGYGKLCVGINSLNRCFFHQFVSLRSLTNNCITVYEMNDLEYA